MTRLLLCLAALPLIQDEEAARIAALVARLDDDSIDVREQAVNDLVAIGRTALARIRREIARKEFKGGPVLGGLCMRLGVERSQDGMSVTLVVEVMNVGDKPAPFVLVEAWDYEIPSMVHDSTSAFGLVTLKQLKGRAPDTRGHSSACGLEPIQEKVILQPGELRSHRLAFGAAKGARGPLPDGEYEAGARYYASSGRLLEGFKEDLVSNSAGFRIGAE